MGVSQYGAAADHAALTGNGEGDPHKQYSLVLVGLASARPAAGTGGLRPGTSYVATDTEVTTVYTGTAWIEPGVTLGEANRDYARLAADNVMTGTQWFRDAVEFAPQPENAFPTQFEPAGTNLITNPSFEVDTAGWTAQNAGTTLSRSTTLFVVGAASLAAAITATTTFGGGISPSTPAAPGDVFSGSASFHLPTSQAVRCQLVPFDAAGAVIPASAALTDQIIPANTWTRVTVTHPMPAGTVAVKLYLMLKDAAPAGGTTLNLDAVLLERSTVATSYIDGSLGTGFAWTGTPHASTSTRAANTVPRTVTDVATTNVLTNPSFETNVAGWTKVGDPTPTRDTTVSRIGSACLRLDFINAGEHGALSDAVPAAAGQTWSLSAWGMTPTSGFVNASPVFIGLRFIDAGGATLANIFSSAVPPPNEWVRVVATGVAPTNTVSVRAILRNAGGGTPLAYSIYYDGAQLEQGNGTSYADGSLGSGFAWTGTPHASTSTRAANTPIPPVVQTPPPYGLVVDAPGRNLFTNPSMEVDLSGYVSRAGTGGGLSRSTSRALVGAASAQVISDNTGAGGANLDDVPIPGGGLDYTISVWAWHGGAVEAGSKFRMLFQYLDANKADLGFGFYDQSWSSTPTRMRATRTAPAAARFIRAWYSAVDSTGARNQNVAQAQWFFDGTQIESGGVPTSYIDGSLGPGYEWEGTPHASPSRRLPGTRMLGTRQSVLASELEVPLHGCRLFKTSDQSLADNAFTTLFWNGEHYDPYDMHGPNSGEVTIKRAGHYLINAAFRRNGGGTTTNYDSIRIVHTPLGGGANTVLNEWQAVDAAAQALAIANSISGTVYCRPGDILRVDAYQASGAARTLESGGGSDRNYFDVIFLGV